MDLEKYEKAEKMEQKVRDGIQKRIEKATERVWKRFES